MGSVFEIYENFRITIEFLANGYLLIYEDRGTHQQRRKAFERIDDLNAFLRNYYTGEWQ